MPTMQALADDRSVVQWILDHLDHKSTDVAEASSRVPVEHYRSRERLAAELRLVFRRYPTPFCPSAALPEAGSYLARDAAGVPLVAVRGADGVVRAFRNACRHRGTQVASGTGCEKAFVCRYHGWTYGLDGALRHVPHDYGFPGLEKESRGLVPVRAVERRGLVFVTQDAPEISDACLDQLPPLVPEGWRVTDSVDLEIAVNWKIFADAFLEGYHIKYTHPKSFYPVQYDNLNLIEPFGRNDRVTFPYRTINKLRAVPPDERVIDGRVLTHVYHLFPNVMLATFPEHLKMIVIEPAAVDRTRFFTWT